MVTATVPSTVTPTVEGAGLSLDVNALLGVLGKVKAGDFSARLPLDWTGFRRRAGPETGWFRPARSPNDPRQLRGLPRMVLLAYSRR